MIKIPREWARKFKIPFGACQRLEIRRSFLVIHFASINPRLSHYKVEFKQASHCLSVCDSLVSVNNGSYSFWMHEKRGGERLL